MKQVFAAKTFGSKTFAAGAMAGVGSALVNDHILGASRVYAAIGCDATLLPAITGIVSARGAILGKVNLDEGAP